MRIAIILPNSTQVSEDYYNNQELGLAKSLLSYGISADIFIFSARAKKISYIIFREEPTGTIRVYQYPGITLPGQQVFSIQLLIYIFKNHNLYSLFQVHDTTQILSALVSYIVKTVKRPCLLCQGVYQDFPEVYKNIIQKIYDFIFTKYLLKSVDYAVCKTMAAKNYLLKKGPISSDKVEVINIGLDVQKFSCQTALDYNKVINLPLAIDILYVGKFTKNRNIVFMVNLANELVCRYKKNITMMFVGDGPEFVNCSKLVNKLHLNNNIHFIKKIRNSSMPLVYSKAKILLLPSSSEIFGMAILEAMYYGVPVLASNTAGPREIIQNQYSGFIIDGFRTEDWYNCIIRLLDNDDYRKQVGINARNRINDKFTWERLAIKYFTVYSTLSNQCCKENNIANK